MKKSLADRHPIINFKRYLPYISTILNDLNFQGLDFRRTIFIFLSNTGGDEINKIAYNSWESGKHREDLTYKVRKFNMFT